MIPNRWTKHQARRAAAVATCVAVFAACGGDGGDGNAGGAGDGAGGDGTTTSATDGEAAPVTTAPPTTAPVTEAPDPTETPSTIAPATTAAIDDVAAVVDAEVIGTIELERNDLAFLISDGEALWATGLGGAVVRVDPDSGAATELTVGEGLISGPLLPTVIDESIWLSAIDESHIVRLDRTTLTADPPIVVPDNPGLVVAGPDDELWLTYLQPAGWRTIDVASGTVGEFVAVETEGEMLGVTAAFGALWAPLYDERVLVKLDSTGAELERLPTGVGPALVREFAGWLWHPNRVDGTIARVDPTTLEVTIVDLNAGGPTIDQPSAVVSTDDAIWARADRLADDRAMVFRIDPVAGSVAGRRTLPGDRRLQQIGGMATVGGRLFVLDRPGRVLLELDTDQFLDADLPDPGTTSGTTTDDPVADPDEAELAEALRSLLAASTTPEQMAERIVDGDRLTEQIAAFKQFFVDNLPGEAYEGEATSVRVDGDVAEIEFFVVVAGEPIVDVIQGTAVREDGRWLLSADSFCRLVATGGIECPADLKGSG